jgi:hypothetical protein
MNEPDNLAAALAFLKAHQRKFSHDDAEQYGADTAAAIESLEVIRSCRNIPDLRAIVLKNFDSLGSALHWLGFEGEPDSYLGEIYAAAKHAVYPNGSPSEEGTNG